MKEMLWVGAGGFIGAITRYLLSRYVSSRVGADFPWGTFVINVTGSFVLGLIMGSIDARALSPVVRLAAGVGFVGAYTTFSTFTYETITLIEDGSALLALLNVGGSVVVGLLCAVAGLLVGRNV
jgi:CrcB protein